MIKLNVFTIINANAGIYHYVYVIVISPAVMGIGKKLYTIMSDRMHTAVINLHS